MFKNRITKLEEAVSKLKMDMKEADKKRQPKKIVKKTKAPTGRPTNAPTARPTGAPTSVPTRKNDKRIEPFMYSSMFSPDLPSPRRMDGRRVFHGGLRRRTAEKKTTKPKAKKGKK